VLGLVGVGVGSYFGLNAASKNSDSKDHCLDNACTPEGFELRRDAIDSGNRATIAFAVGAAGLVTGAILFFVVGASETGEVGGETVNTRLPIDVATDGETTRLFFNATF
jgi:hypothetical protein